MKTRAYAILNTAGLTFLVVMSCLAENNLFSDLTVGEVSAKYDTLFTPAAIAFGVWGLIYASLAAFCIYHLVKAFGSDDNDQVNCDTKAIGWLFVINTITAGVWLLVWVREQIALSVFLMLVQLITLILISIRAHIANPERPLLSRIFTQFPLSIYFGWICIATIANISAYLISLNWDGGGISESNWVIITIGIATLLSLFIILVRRNFFFGLVIVWALYGIVLKREQADQVQFQTVINAAWAAIIIIVIALLIRVIRKEKFITQPSSSSV